jgi:hypothetical protein
MPHIEDRFARNANALVEDWKTLGFDMSARDGRSARIGCSQCDATLINGAPCHETGCPNQTFECKGCNAQVERRGAYCADCQ